MARRQVVDLVQRDDHRDPERIDTTGDEAVAGADSLARRHHEEHYVDVLEGAVHRALHPLGQLVHRPLETREVRENELVILAVRDPVDAPPGRVRHR